MLIKLPEGRAEPKPEPAVETTPEQEFECHIVMENEVMSSFNMRHINGTYLKVRGVHTVVVVGENLYFGDSNAYKVFYSAKVNMFQKFICHYSPQS